MNRAVGAVLVATLVVLAGCSGGLAGGTASPAGAVTGDGSDADAVAGPSGSVNFYVSDRPGDMDDFEHLNVTVTAVRFHLVERANDSAADGTATTTTANGTTTATVATTAASGATTTTATTDADESEADPEGEPDRDGGEPDRDGGEDGRWVVREVNATTVDLTRLRGDNATLVEEFDVPAGEYDRVFLDVSDVNGTLDGGESTRVKLPSGKLQLHTAFEVEAGSEVDFVYDVMVHKAGKSGKYILRPVLSESGTDQPIERVDARGRPVDGEEDGSGDEREREDDSLTATLSGEAVPGENVTLAVTGANGTDPVANATVTVNGERVGTTGPDGAITVAVPADADELEIEVEAGDREGELERDLEGDADGGDGA